MVEYMGAFDYVFKCICGCEPETDTPFYYSLPNFELGVLADENIRPVNRWTDGVAGVPTDIITTLEDSYDFPYCIECHESLDWECVTGVREDIPLEQIAFQLEYVRTRRALLDPAYDTTLCTWINTEARVLMGAIRARKETTDV